MSVSTHILFLLFSYTYSNLVTFIQFKDVSCLFLSASEQNQSQDLPNRQAELISVLFLYFPSPLLSLPSVFSPRSHIAQ